MSRHAQPGRPAPIDRAELAAMALQVEHVSCALDALCDLLQAANGQHISSTSALTLLEPLRHDMLHACDTLDRLRLI